MYKLGRGDGRGYKSGKFFHEAEDRHVLLGGLVSFFFRFLTCFAA